MKFAIPIWLRVWSARPNPQIDAEQLLAEVARVTQSAKEHPKKEAFDVFLSQLSDATLLSLLDASLPTRDRGRHHAAQAPLRTAITFLRFYVHGDRRNGVGIQDDEWARMIETVGPYFIMELIRRRGCFESFEMPPCPWAFNAKIRVHSPKRTAINKTIMELTRRQMPCPPLLTDKDLLQQMKAAGLGVEFQMPLRSGY